VRAFLISTGLLCISCLLCSCLLFLGACGERKTIDDVLPVVDAGEVAEESIDWMSDDDEERDTSVERAGFAMDAGVARAELNELAESIKVYHVEYGRLPSDLGEIAPRRDIESEPRVIPDEIDRVPTDPWGQPFRYVLIDETSFTLRCNGPDTEPDTADDLIETVSVR